MTPNYQYTHTPEPPRKTTRGMERRNHVRGQKLEGYLSTPNEPITVRTQKKAEPQSESWWTRTDKPFAELVAEQQPRLQGTEILLPHPGAAPERRRKTAEAGYEL